MANISIIGTAFYINKMMMNYVRDFAISKLERLSLLTFKRKNKKYILINCHAPIKDNEMDLQKVDDFWNLIKLNRSNIRKPFENFPVKIYLAYKERTKLSETVETT